MNPGLSGGSDRFLAERLCEGQYACVRIIAGRQPANDFDELHDRHRIEEMQARKTIGPPCSGRQLGDAQRRRVRAENGRVCHDVVELLVDRGFLLDVLDDRFDDEVARLEILEVGRWRNVAEGSVPLLRCHLPLLDGCGQRLLDARHPLRQEGIHDLPHVRPVTGRGRDLRDTGSHQTAAENANGANVHISFQLPVSSYQLPATSFQLPATSRQPPVIRPFLQSRRFPGHRQCRPPRGRASVLAAAAPASASAGAGYRSCRADVRARSRRRSR